MQHPTQLTYMFDPNQFNLPSGGGNYIQQSGKYPVVISAAYLKASAKNAANLMAVIELTITDGELKGQSTVDYLNILHHSVETKRIANEQLAAYATAAGVGTAFQDLAILCNRPFQVFIEAKEVPRDDDPNKKFWENRVKQWFYADGSDIKKGVFGSGSQQQQPQQQFAQPQAQQFAAPTAPAQPQAPDAPAPQTAPVTMAVPPTAPAPQFAPQAAPAQPQQQQFAAPAQPQFAAPQQAQQAPQFAAPQFAPPQ